MPLALACATATRVPAAKESPEQGRAPAQPGLDGQAVIVIPAQATGTRAAAALSARLGILGAIVRSALIVETGRATTRGTVFVTMGGSAIMG